ncbi:hypothetical protein VP01_1661g2 [Puccinia sorghi]|uniref:Uncharacterized protein n=1 Tax=Puccinia sorghi TaxID=27349 RepID=A0A0L6VGU7_9BASI|nr:hypothetical protein VP01_1661g2 [Puccinia sorghi]
MDNPAGAIKDTEMEDLLAAQAAHEQAVKEMNGKRKFWMQWTERINIHMKRIYDKNLPNTKCDCHIQGYIDPSDPHQYILITFEACQEWACAFPEWGLMITFPVSLLKHYSEADSELFPLRKITRNVDSPPLEPPESIQKPAL